MTKKRVLLNARAQYPTQYHIQNVVCVQSRFGKRMKKKEVRGIKVINQPANDPLLSAISYKWFTVK